ncbi:restriction endonuclease subunit S [Vibrio cholerae]|uniref:restriction endonuclease subunit S n=1 Tax=Vibrio TaxID=662 RepID=UPI000273453B|nr:MULTISPECIES: restriction endonuclease subunit S [Vibrio]EJH63370.1 type I restriction modification DNA specificity domain protein [Vibrio cholerae HE-45]EKG89329.1 type I restriction modification DNA specificity domain protein [Vibrio paracholerae HE-16]MCO7024045.1 restriction endonuclease subunit S [Vibrio paracholerae]RBM58154.1 restriction endonuclease subunit S [Vibrio paracholerae]
MSEVEATLLPKSWIILPLSEVIQMQKGKKPHDLGEKSNLRTVPYINIKAFEKGIVTEYAPEQDAVYCTEKDVLLVWDGARAGLSGRGVNGYVGSTLVKVTSDIVEMNYLSYYFESIYSILNTQTKGVGIPHINPVVLNNLPFNLAPENEQARIVDKLEELFSELDEGVKELKAAQIKLSQYRQSLLKSAVEGSLTQQWRAENSDRVQETGEQLLARILKQRREQWQQQKLVEFAEKGKIPPKNWQDKYPEPVQPDTTDLPELPEGWVWASVAQLGSVQLGRQRTPSKMKGENPQKYIRAANITEQGINFNDVLEMDFTEKEIPIYQLKTGDVLLTEASGSPEHVGRPCIWPDVDGVYCFQNTVIRFQPSVISADFSFFIFYAYQKLGKYIDVSGGVGINHLSAGKFSKIAVPLPSLVEQGVLVAEITAELDAIDRQTEATVLGLKQAEAQRKNILKSAFSGQLVPQEPNDEPASVLLEKIKQEREALAQIPKPRKPSKPKKKVDLMNTLLEVLTVENNWIDAQDAFQKCGIVDGTSTDRIEEIYTELRKLEKAGKIEIQRQGDFDQLKLIKQDVKED